MWTLLPPSTDRLRALTRRTTRGTEDRYTDRKTQGQRKLVSELQVGVPSRGEAEPTPSVHTLITVAQTAIRRGLDSQPAPLLRRLTTADGQGCFGTLLCCNERGSPDVCARLIRTTEVRCKPPEIRTPLRAGND